jgi:hypothetical protein
MPLSIHDATITADAWLRRIHAAGTRDERVEVLREYVATWSAEDIARLPRDCRPDLRNLATKEAENFLLHVAWCARYPLFALQRNPPAQGMQNTSSALGRFILGVRRVLGRKQKDEGGGLAA